MLSSLHIENIAVIKNVDIDLSEGFNVLTGETGAGKSILIDSINFLLGARPSKDLIRSGETKALVSALFTDTGEIFSRMESPQIEPDEDGSIYLTRELDSDGKTRSKINGRTVPISLQREISSYLLSIHGQNDNRILLSPTAHLEYLDAYCDNSELLAEYKKHYEHMTECKRKLLSLVKDEREKSRTIELLRYQVEEIDSAKLKKGEEEELKNERKKVKDAENIAKQTRLITRALYRNEKTYPAYELVKKASKAIESISEYIPNSEDYIAKLNDMAYVIEDIGLAVMDISESSYEDPEKELDRIENRLELITKLEKKYGNDIEEILAYRDKSYRELKETEQSDELTKELKAEYDKCRKEALKIATALSEKRREGAKTLEESVVSELAYLEMPKVRFKVDITKSEDENQKVKLQSTGIDNVEFLLSANQGEELRPLAKIASGGELSRIMLALKSVNAKDARGETLIFDEIDAGVSGKTSQKIGMRLRRLSSDNQVICVTHSAQIAAEAHRHYLIKKSESEGRVSTSVTPLDREGRIQEIARIMGGVNITEKLIMSAAELLDGANDK